MLEVLAPVAGTVVDITEVPDPVFSGGLVGPGAAILPDPQAGRTAVAPITGRVLKLHPHAFILVSDGDGAGGVARSVLVHLGIDTVELKGDGFTLLVSEGDDVVAGQPIAVWDPADVEAGGRSPMVPVVALEAPPTALTAAATPGAEVTSSDPLFTITG